jgi:hypothetical protein
MDRPGHEAASLLDGADLNQIVTKDAPWYMYNQLKRSDGQLYAW